MNDLIAKLERLSEHPHTSRQEVETARAKLAALRNRPLGEQTTQTEETASPLSSRDSDCSRLPMVDYKDSDEGIEFHWFSGWHVKRGS